MHCSCHDSTSTAPPSEATLKLKQGLPWMALLLTLLSWCPPLPSPWLSPAVAWFIFFSAVVAAIAVMPTTSGAQASSSRHRLCRSGSSVALDRLRSFFTFPVHAAAGGGVTAPPPIDGSDSSDASGSHCFYCCSAAAAATTGGTAAISVAQPSAPVAMATVEDDAPPAPPPEEEAEAEKEQDHDESISLDEAYALAQQHRAQTLVVSQPPPPATAASATVIPAALPMEHKKKKPAKVAAAADARRRVSKAAAGEAVEGKAELNARAELFIRQFREDLRLQRLNSILKHTHALGSPTAAR